MAQVDLVVRGGHVADGLGGEPVEADVGVQDGRIAAVGRIAARGREEIDARGHLVTPGFVDIHTHYDGQAVWDSRLAPSSWHGVTTAVMGNCGVGFAPVRPADRVRLVELMEGVEDIPGAALHEGLDWSWESFEQYLDALDARPHDMDLCAQLPHGALRVFVMANAARAWRRRPRTTSRRCVCSQRRRCVPARSASRRRARSTTARCTAIPPLRCAPAKTSSPRSRWA